MTRVVSEPEDVSPDGTRRLRVGDVELDLDGVLVRVAGVRVALTYREFLVLGVLMEHAGRVVPRDEILQAAWGPARPRRRMVDVYVRRVRARLGDTEELEQHIRTVRGQGYVFDLPAGDLTVALPSPRPHADR